MFQRPGLMANGPPRSAFHRQPPCQQHPNTQTGGGKRQSRKRGQIYGDDIDAYHEDIGTNQTVGTAFDAIFLRREVLEKNSPAGNGTARADGTTDRSRQPQGRGGGIKR